MMGRFHLNIWLGIRNLACFSLPLCHMLFSICGGSVSVPSVCFGGGTGSRSDFMEFGVWSSLGSWVHSFLLVSMPQLADLAARFPTVAPALTSVFQGGEGFRTPLAQVWHGGISVCPVTFVRCPEGISLS